MGNTLSRISKTIRLLIDIKRVYMRIIVGIVKHILILEQINCAQNVANGIFVQSVEHANAIILYILNMQTQIPQTT